MTPTKTAARPAKLAKTAGAKTPDRILQLGMAFWGSKCLLSAVELGVFTELAKNPLDLEALRRRFGLHERSARDFFDALVSLGMLERKGAVYSNTPETAIFLDKDKPSYVGGILEMANSRLYPFWASLTEGLKTGRPQNEAKRGGDLFDELYKDAARMKEFCRAMTGISQGPARAIAAKFPWKTYKTFVDVGTAQGALPVTVALEHRHLRGVGLDLPVVRPIFEEYVRTADLADRLEFGTCDFFKQELPKADVIVMGHILHDWSLEQKKMLIGKVHRALPKGGAFIAYEALIDDDRRQNAFGLLMSLNMLIETEGGFDYTGADGQAWMRAAGFRETRVEHLVGPDSMVVAIK
ncbi:MAG: methyltransferase [Proteobacteria bacterium]|nr:methyltransferase [Pseudomonadota bacterium]